MSQQDEDEALLETFRSLGVADIKFAYQWRQDTPKPAYYCYPLAPKGVTVLVAGREKSGKSKMLYSLLACIERGEPFAGNPCEKAKVMMFQEEPATIIKKHADELDLGEEVRFPISRMATLAQIKKMVPLAVEAGYRVFCLDTASRFLAIENENDPALVAAALRPLEDMASVWGLTFFINLHANKNKANSGLDILRGSTAYAGTASHIVTIVPVKQSAQRIIEIFGRLEHNARFTLDHDLTTHQYTIAENEINSLNYKPAEAKQSAGRPNKMPLGKLLELVGKEPFLMSQAVANCMGVFEVVKKTAQGRFTEAIEQGFVVALADKEGWFRRSAMEVVE